MAQRVHGRLTDDKLPSFRFVFNAAFAFIPLFFAPLSESIGRNPVYLYSCEYSPLITAVSAALT